jgi:hypothetical protein
MNEMHRVSCRPMDRIDARTIYRLRAGIIIKYLTVIQKNDLTLFLI